MLGCGVHEKRILKRNSDVKRLLPYRPMAGRLAQWSSSVSHSVSPACARNCWYDGETELIGDPGSLIHQTLLPLPLYFGLRAIHVRLVTIDLLLPAGDLELGGDGVLEFRQRVCAPAAGDARAILRRGRHYSLNRRFRLFSGCWGEVQAAAVEVDRMDKVLFVAEAAGRVLHPLDLGVMDSLAALVMRCLR